MKIDTIYPGVPLDCDFEEVYNVELPLKKGKTYGEVLWMGDYHIGHPSFSESQLTRFLNLLRDESHMRMVGMGDYFEAQEFSQFIQEQEIYLKTQIKKFLSLHEPVKGQILAMVYGNHDERILKDTKMAIDLLEYVALKLGNRNIVIGKPQRGIILNFHVGDQVYPTYVLHSKTGAIVHSDTQLRRTAGNWAIPLIVHGHVHRKAWKEKTFFSIAEVDGQLMRVVLRQFWLLTGCFLKHPSYAESRSYPVSDVGAPIVRFHSGNYAIEYIDPRVHPEYAKYFKRDSTHQYTYGPVEITLKEKLVNRPKCDKCGSTHVQSRGEDWRCIDCGNCWRKERRFKK